MSAEVVHGDLEAGAGARRGLLEHHPQHAAGTRRVRRARRPQRAQLLGPPDERLDPVRRQVVEGQKSLRRSGLAHRDSSSTASRISIASSISALLTTSGGTSRTTFVAGDRQQEAVRARTDHDVARIAVDDQPLQEPPAARAARLGAPPLGQPQQRRSQIRADLAAVIEQSKIVDRPLDVERGGGGERVAAERRGVRPRLEAAADLLVRQHGADRDPARQPLGQRHHVGDHPLASRTRRRCRCDRCRSGSRRRSAPFRCRCRCAAAPAGSRAVAG